MSLSEQNVEIEDELSISGDFIERKTFFEGLLNKTKDTALYERLAKLHMSRNEFKQASVYYEKYLENFPDKIESYINLGNSLMLNKELCAAKEIFEFAVEKFPEDIRGHERLGRLYIAGDDFLKAESVYQKIVENFEYNELVCYNYCKVLEQHKKFDKIQQLLEPNIDKLLDNKPLLWRYARSLSQLNKMGNETSIKLIESNKLPAMGYNYISTFDNELIHLIAQHLKKQKVSLVFLNYKQENYKNIGDYEQEAIDGKLKYRKNEEYAKKLWGENPDFSKSYLSGINKSAPIICSKNGLTHMDFSSKYCNYSNGKRVTVPFIERENKIYLYGPSYIKGVYCEDSQTISSYLQQLNNDYQVLNLGLNAKGILPITFDILNSKYNQGDIVFISSNRTDYKFSKKDLQSVDVDYAEKNKDDVIFVDGIVHVNSKGNKLTANQIQAEVLSDSDSMIFNPQGNLQNYEKPGFISENQIETAIKYLGYYENSIITQMKQDRNTDALNEYLEQIKRIPLKKGSVGSIVMNCNPFTNGHRYLIEYASRKVDNLIIFVVQEDKSEFKFEDRIELIKKGTKDLENVYVVGSGDFIISSITFPEYFSKDTPTSVKIDMSDDLDTFGLFIAPALNIKTRFVGEEPNCSVTKEYNRQMNEILPFYGVEIEEIPRKNFDGTPISASLVRKYLRENKMQKLKELVPATTYEYLMENHIGC